MYIITGGAGFIGSAMLWQLNELGIKDVLIVDNLATSEKWKNLVPLHYHDYIQKDKFIADVRAKGLDKSIRGVIHLGACSSTTESNAEYLMENNFHYTRDLCLAALAKNIRFINASSASTYGDGSLGFDDNPQLVQKLRPLNMYGYTKQLFDLWLEKQNYPKEVVSLKFFNVFGPNEYHKGSMQSLVCKAVPQILESNKLKLFASNHPDYANGEQKRDFIYIKDCTKILTWFLNNQLHGIFNLGTGQAKSWNQLASYIFKAMEKKKDIEYIPMPYTLIGKYQYFTEAKMSWLQTHNYPYNFYSLETAIYDYVQNYLLKNQAHLESNI